VGRRFSAGVIGISVTLLLAACGSNSQTPKTASTTPAATSKPATADDAKQFVQRFYDWYVPYGAAHSDAAALTQPEMKAAFAPELLRALLEDVEAARKNPGEIVGLDFDPVTNSQDPCARYKAFRAHQTGDTYWVDVGWTPDCPIDRQGREVAVTVQLTCSSPTTCSIFNLQYPGPPPSDLRSDLKQLHDQRGRHTSPGRATSDDVPSSSKS
jgi:hypothetical protein